MSQLCGGAPGAPAEHKIAVIRLRSVTTNKNPGLIFNNSSYSSALVERNPSRLTCESSRPRIATWRLPSRQAHSEATCFAARMSSRLLCRPLAIGETTYRCWSNILRNAMQARPGRRSRTSTNERSNSFNLTIGRATFANCKTWSSEPWFCAMARLSR